MTPPKTPWNVGDVTVENFGLILADKPGFRDSDSIYPAGFRSTRKHLSMVNATNKCMYTSEVLEQGGKPLFRVTCHDDPPETVEDTTMQGVWNSVLDRISQQTRRSSRGGVQGPAKKGADMYGFSNEKIKRAIMELPGVHDAAPPPHRSARFSAASKHKDEKDTKSQNGDKKEKEDKKDKEQVGLKRQKRIGYSGRKGGPYVQPPEMQQLRLNEWRCMEEGVEVMEPRKFKPSQRKCEEDEEDSSEQHNRNELHEIWELAAAMHCIRCFKTALNLQTLTLEDLHTAFLECNSTFKIINLKMLLPSEEKKKAQDMADGDDWLHYLRNFLRDQEQFYDEVTQQIENEEPMWAEILESDPMPDSIEQYYGIPLRDRAMILWLLVERLFLYNEEEMRDANLPNIDWDNAESLRMTPSCYDKDDNAFWYFEGSDGILFREGMPRLEGHRRSTVPHFEAISRGCEELFEVAKDLIKEAKRTKNEDLHEFATWLHEEEAPKLIAKKEARERAKSRAQFLELMPRKRSTRIVDKEEQKKHDEEEAERRKRDDAKRREEDDRRRREREREKAIRDREREEAAARREEEKVRLALEAEREKRAKKRRRLVMREAMSRGEDVSGMMSPKKQKRQQQNDEEQKQRTPRKSGRKKAQNTAWYEPGNHVEVFFDDDWWKAKVAKVRDKEDDLDLLICYEGGTAEDDEWISLSSGRLRAPSETWDIEVSSAEEQDEEQELDMEQEIDNDDDDDDADDEQDDEADQTYKQKRNFYMPSKAAADAFPSKPRGSRYDRGDRAGYRGLGAFQDRAHRSTYFGEASNALPMYAEAAEQVEKQTQPARQPRSAGADGSSRQRHSQGQTQADVGMLAAYRGYNQNGDRVHSRSSERPQKSRQGQDGGAGVHRTSSLQTGMGMDRLQQERSQRSPMFQEAVHGARTSISNSPRQSNTSLQHHAGMSSSMKASASSFRTEASRSKSKEPSHESTGSAREHDGPGLPRGYRHDSEGGSRGQVKPTLHSHASLSGGSFELSESPHLQSQLQQKQHQLLQQMQMQQLRDQFLQQQQQQQQHTHQHQQHHHQERPEQVQQRGSGGPIGLQQQAFCSSGSPHAHASNGTNGAGTHGISAIHNPQFSYPQGQVALPPMTSFHQTPGVQQGQISGRLPSMSSPRDRGPGGDFLF